MHHVPNEASLDANIKLSPVKIWVSCEKVPGSNSWNMNYELGKSFVLIKMKNEKIISEINMDSLVPNNFLENGFV